MTDLAKELRNALRVCNNLASAAKAEGDLPTMYAANRAWHQLCAAEVDLGNRRRAMTNGEQK